MKKITKISIVVILLLVIIGLSMTYMVRKNDKYLDDLTASIQENYKTEEEITYSNLYGNYYVFTTKSQVIVLTKEYTEVLKEKISILDENPNQYPLIYKTNKLMYESTKIEDNQVTYEYYDALTGEKIKNTVLERK